jgi:ribose transport system permease protein
VAATQSSGVNAGSSEQPSGPRLSEPASAAVHFVRVWRGLYRSQERIVFAIAVLLFVGFCVFVPGILSAGNVLSLVQNVSIVDILGVGMAQAIIGCGIDLSMVATMAMSVAWTFDLMQRGAAPTLALFAGLAMAVVVGLINGVLIA